MTIQKRNKRKRGRPKNLPPPLEEKDIQYPPVDRMVHNYTRYCRYCGQGSYSTRCDCGGLTVINKGG